MTTSTKAVEDYVKTIFLLRERSQAITTNGIAQQLDIKPASVTGMLKKLAKLGLINYEPYKEIELTDSGRKIALEVIRHHRLIELFLAEALGMSWDEVHDEAEQLEHVISEQLEARIDAALGYPSFDPHGDPIPGRNGEYVKRELVPLVDLEVGGAGEVARVSAQAPDALRYLGELGIKPGRRVEICAREPLQGPLTVRIADETKVLANWLAEEIWITQ